MLSTLQAKHIAKKHKSTTAAAERDISMHTAVGLSDHIDSLRLLLAAFPFHSDAFIEFDSF